MKIFFISDIHGNQFALEAILSKAKAVQSDQIFCLGDISGYFTGIKEVIRLLKENHVVSIKGNHDAYLFNSQLINKNKSYYNAFCRTKRTIGAFDYKWLSRLEDYIKVKINDISFEMYHGGKNDIFNEYIYPNSIDETKYNNANVFVFGHSHLQFAIKLNNKIFANPGSVGLPRNGDIRAHGLLFDTENKLFHKFKVLYDLNKLNDMILKDNCIDKKYLHNVNFGRTSNKLLHKEFNKYLNSRISSILELNQFSIISTLFGAVLKHNEILIYLASFADGSVEITSNTLLFNWQIKLFNLRLNNTNSIKELKQDLAGIYYFKVLSFEKILKENIPILLIETLQKIKLFKNMLNLELKEDNYDYL